MFGQDAISTMKAISENWEAGTSKTVVVATASGYWDPLVASALAGRHQCPIPPSMPRRSRPRGSSAHPVWAAVHSARRSYRSPGFSRC
ncbi:cell wall-binding repeat-containing protein [Gordonibacter sp. Marseille-P4307]|uniref:cell wall-binding repeat-containing protein n=1 Tax=Gordonibacter sp. Marseille-P4307 TaxID=2161815 RepID=UPI003519FEB0